VTPSLAWLSESIALPALEQTVESATSVISDGLTSGRWLLVRDIECSGIIIKPITRRKWAEFASAARQRDCALTESDITSKKAAAIKVLAG
jgi:hypothetical protein